jgi:hypothetical protein
MTTDILAQQTGDLAVTKAQLRAAMRDLMIASAEWVAGAENPVKIAEAAMSRLINALDIPEDGAASDGAGSER